MSSADVDVDDDKPAVGFGLVFFGTVVFFALAATDQFLTHRWELYAICALMIGAGSILHYVEQVVI